MEIFGSFAAIAAVAIIILAYLSAFVIHTQEAGIIERFGKFHRVARAGLNFKIPLIDVLRKRMSLQVLQLNVEVETKTKDNVFVSIPVAVQYQVVDNREEDAFYKLTNPEQQIVAYVQDNVRTSLASMNLDEAFESKDRIALNVEATLSESMGGYGWAIRNTLVTDIRPDEKVRASMNSINAAQRERAAAISLAEAEKIKMVKQAEGEAESKRLQGEGVANERKAIVQGMKEQIEMLKDAGVDVTPENLLIATQYLDTMRDVARYGKSSVLMMPSGPSAHNDLINELRNSMIATNKLN